MGRMTPRSLKRTFYGRINVHSARHEARLSSSKRVNLVGSTAFSDEVFMLGKTTVRSAVSPNTGGAPVLKSPVTEDCVQHGGHQPGLAPTRMIINVVEDMFRPPEERRGEKTRAALAPVAAK
jgi:hypothetical protein